MSASGETHDFMLAHDADVEIGDNRGGLETYAWEGIEISEVSIAALLEDNEPAELPQAWRHFHVFLPTADPCPYPLLVNGAFVSDLSRQEIRVGEQRNDYNRFLMRRVAALFRDLANQFRSSHVPMKQVLRLLDRRVTSPGAPAATGAGQALYEAVRDELAVSPFLPLESGGLVALNQCVVPPLVSVGSVGEEFRKLLPVEVGHNGRHFPKATLCRSELAQVVIDHGAVPLSPREAANVLGTADLSGIELKEHESGGVLVDPVLHVLEGLWAGLGLGDRVEFAAAVRHNPLFPVGREQDVVHRVATDGGVACFYPPRSLKCTVPLERLSFLMQELCWGALLPTERNQLLKDQLTAWQALFELREFKFPDVMRASVLPALDLDPDEDAKRRLERLRDLSSLAAICQLSGRTPDPARPLRYERLGANRAIFNLSRLPVPCRPRHGTEVEWRPAYEVYLGEDWLGDESIEKVLSALKKHNGVPPDIPLLASPDLFNGLLGRFRHLEGAVEGAEEDEVSLEEDEEAPPDQAERERWLYFLTWIGVNRVLRPVHFHDVEDRGTGWITTKDLSRPEGWAFRQLAPQLWDEFRQAALESVGDMVREKDGAPYFYRVHDLEHIVPLLKAAAEDASTEVANTLFSHPRPSRCGTPRRETRRSRQPPVARVCEGRRTSRGAIGPLSTRRPRTRSHCLACSVRRCPTTRNAQGIRPLGFETMAADDPGGR